MEKRPSRAFTLVEVLLATGITALLAAFILIVAGRMLGLWSRSAGELGAGAQARFIFERLTIDLQAALYRDDGGVWLAATVLDTPDNSGLWQAAPRQKPAGNAGSLRLDAPALADARYGEAGVWLRFFTTAQGANDDFVTPEAPTAASAPVAVSYQIIRHRTGNSPAGNDREYLLYRAVVRPAQSGARPGTLEAGFNLDPTQTAGAYMTPDPLNDGTQLGDPFGTTHPDNVDAVLAENVVDFGVRLYRRTGDGGLQRIFPMDGNDLTHLARAPAEASAGIDCFPEVADLMVRILTEEGAQRVAEFESSPSRIGVRPAQYASDAEWWWGLVEANSRVFTRRIVLPGQLP